MLNPTAANTTRTDWLLAGGVAILAAVLFLPAAGFEFLDLDDEEYVTARLEIQQGIGLETLRFVATNSVGANWHPLTMLSHAMDCSVYGLNAGGHHLTNILLHAACAALAYLTLLSLTGMRGASLAAAAIFAVHPLRVESVAWVAERKDVLSGVLGLACLWAYAHWARHGGAKRYALVCALLALGLMAKPMLVTWPMLMLVLDYWPLNRFFSRENNEPTWRVVGQRLWEKGPLFALVAASCVITFAVQRHAGAMTAVIDISARLLNAARAYGLYLAKTSWPTELYIPYELQWRDVTALDGLVPAASLVVLTFFALAMRRRMPWIVVGWLWFLGTLVPVIGLVQVGLQSMADRYTYLPHLGLFLAISCGVSQWAGTVRWRRVVAIGAAGLTVIALAGRTWQQLPLWKDSRTLFLHTLACDPENSCGLCMMGKLEMKASKYREAGDYFLRSIRRLPTGDAFSSLGEAELRQGHLEEALYYLQLATANQGPDAIGSTLLCLADAVSLLGGRDQAIGWYESALAIEPNLAVMQADFGHQIRLPDRQPQLVIRLREALAATPDDPVVANRLAWVMATSENVAVRDVTKALGLARLACRGEGERNPHYLDTLAAALANGGQFSEAERTAARAETRCRELEAEDADWKIVADLIAERRELYAKRQAYREDPKQGQRLFTPLYPPPRVRATEQGYVVD